MLAASPDGFVGEEIVLEVKCPFSAKNKKITATTVPSFLLERDEELQLKLGHNYYYHIQGHLLCTGKYVID